MPTLVLPSPPNGVVGISTASTASAVAELLGEDIYFDVADGVRADYVVTPAGDWRTVAGEEALMQSLLRRTITNPGDWRTKPRYGVGARRYLKMKDTAANRAELEQRIRAQYLIDKRVERVDAVLIERLEGANGAVLKINVKFTPRGRLRDGGAEIAISISA